MNRKKSMPKIDRTMRKVPRTRLPSMLVRLCTLAAVGADCAPEPARSFGAFTAALDQLVEWLCDVETVVMKSTSFYWIPIFELLERIIRAILAGDRDSEALACLRHYSCHSSVETIAKALTGTYGAEHLFALDQALAL
ncbi:hypothetical protein [Bradyrhizobium sp. 166]|uniref:hypothetical protein n=1 Tax=Bradyrhizobium sp. 166 TaxID=2782638 RepID=UPI001FF98214|nr:hypothetical protein [Bradyrhizobium sp. 166]